MADIYLETLSYRKTEADVINNDQDRTTVEELSLKLDATLAGSPSGIATLDASGTHPAVEIPFANNTEAYEGTDATLVISPATLKYAVDVGTIPAGAYGTASGVCPLGTDVKVNPIYLPVSPQVDTFVVTTLAQMYALVGVTEGDRCIVTDDPTDTNGDVNGEWVADIDDPSTSDWSHLPNLSSVTSVNGQTGIVEILTTTQGDDNATNITTWALVSDDNTNDIAALDSRVGTNETDIAALVVRDTDIEAKADANTVLIESNDTDIAAIDVRVTDLEALVSFAPFYEYNKTTDFTVTNDVYEEVGRLTTTGDAGTYEYQFSMTYSLDSTNTSAYVRFSIDGGSTWNEFTREPRDVTDRVAEYYAFPYVHAGGAIDIVVEVRKENAADVMVVYFLDIIAERKI